MKITSFLRRLFYSIAGVVLAWSWKVMFRWVWRPRLVFVAYPASRKYIRKIVFKWVYRFIPVPEISPIGLIVRPGMIGVYATTKELLMELDDHRLSEITDQIPNTFPFARSVSLAGSWPSMLEKAGISSSAPPLVDATIGTIYAMDKVCTKMTKKKKMMPGQACLGIIGGGGFVGRVLVPKIQHKYKKIIIIDPCYDTIEKTNNLTCTSEPSFIKKADIVLVLTPRGDDAAVYASYAVPDQVWGDDTFPDMTPATQKKLIKSGVKLYKTAMVDGALKFIPPLPTFGANNVPGCLISGIVNEIEPNITDMDRFYFIADSTGLQAKLFHHRKAKH